MNLTWKRTRSNLALAAAALFLICAFSCQKAEVAAPQSQGTPPPREAAESASTAKLKPESERNQAPDFELEDSTGKKLKLSDLRGKVLLLNFWATWCGPCKIEIPWFVEMERKWKDRGFAVVGVSMDEDGWNAVKPFMADFKVNYRMVLGTEEVANQYGGVQALPTTYIIDPNGKVASVHMGIVSKKTFEEEILALLPQPSASASGARTGVAAAAE